MTSQKPVVIIVHGGWHVPEHYGLLVSQLEKVGFTVECPALPSCTNVKPSEAYLDDDISHIQNIAESQLSAGRDVLVLMHSYGGVVGTHAFGDVVASQPGRGSVKALVYMTSFLPFENQSAAEVLGGLPPWIVAREDGTIVPQQGGGDLFYGDLSAEDREKWVEKLTVMTEKTSFAKPTKPMDRVAWRTIPTTYLFCSNDQAIPQFLQEMMVDKVEKEGIKVFREECPSSHSPFLSMPERVAEVVLAASER